MRIASWNINGLRRRLEGLCLWAEQAAVDILLLQELKCPSEQFPGPALTQAGWHWLAVCQPRYNGVALLSRWPLEAVCRALPESQELDLERDAPQARYIEVDVQGLRIVNLYLPNGNPIDGPRFTYKLAWMDLLNARARQLIARERPTLWGGDFNVLPRDQDAARPQEMRDDALMQPQSRRRWWTLAHLGLSDAFTALDPKDPGYTFYDYQAAAFARGLGLRIDHFLLSAQVAPWLRDCRVDTAPRGGAVPSDHCPLVLDLDIPPTDQTETPAQQSLCP